MCSVDVSEVFVGLEEKMLRLLLFLCLLTAEGLCQGPPPPEEPEVEFGLVLLSPIYVCPDLASLSYVDCSKTDVVRFNESISFITGFINFKESFHEDTMVEIVLEKEANGRVEKVMTLEICNVCEEMQNPESDYRVYFQQFGFPEKCPFEPGEYQIHDLTADTAGLPINSANAGNYVATINVYTAAGDCQGEKTFVACLKMDCCIEPL